MFLIKFSVIYCTHKVNSSLHYSPLQNQLTLHQLSSHVFNGLNLELGYLSQNACKIFTQRISVSIAVMFIFHEYSQNVRFALNLQKYVLYEFIQDFSFCHHADAEMLYKLILIMRTDIEHSVNTYYIYKFLDNSKSCKATIYIIHFEF